MLWQFIKTSILANILPLWSYSVFILGTMKPGGRDGFPRPIIPPLNIIPRPIPSTFWLPTPLDISTNTKLENNKYQQVKYQLRAHYGELSKDLYFFDYI